MQFILSDRPTFFVSVLQTSVTQAAFLLQNETGEEIFIEKTVPLSASKGMMSYTLPTDFSGAKNTVGAFPYFAILPKAIAAVIQLLGVGYNECNQLQW